MICKPISERKRFILGMLGVLAIIGAYCWLSMAQHAKNPLDTTIPNLFQMIDGVKKACLPDRLGNIWILQDCYATGSRLMLGLLIGVVAAVVGGIAMGCYRHLSALFMPPIVILSKVPPTAMLAIYFVVFGMNENLMIAIIALGVIPSLTVAIYSSVDKDISENLIHKSLTLGASHLDIIEAVIFRHILPRILQNIQLQIGPAMVFLIAVEWLVANVGFGYRLRMQSRLLNMNVVYFYLMLLAVSGFFIEYSLTVLRRKTCRWFGE